MALTEFQRKICRLLAEQRIASGESYLAGGATLNEFLAAPRLSQDVDLFHDTDRALEESSDADRRLLEQHGFVVRLVRERRAFVEVQVIQGGESVLLQWVRDSAFRFFPLLEHPDFGLTLHPFDLATNKALALVGRLEVRDWVDIIECSERLQPFGYLAWAACGKDLGFSPSAIVEQAARNSHSSSADVESLAFSCDSPDVGALSRRWRVILDAAKEIIDILPPDESGRCILDSHGALFRRDAAALRADLATGAVRFHSGSIRGAMPELVQRS